MSATDPNLFERFLKSVSEFSERPCLISKKGDRYETWTFARLRRVVFGLRQVLLDQGLKPGDRAAILLSNGPLWPASFLAVVSLRAVAVPIDAQLSPDQIKKILIHSQARALLTEEKFGVSLSEALQEETKLDVLFLDKDSGERPGEPENEKSQPFDFPSETLAALFYTSGTTQEHKAVMLTHGNLLANVDSIHPLRLVTQSDTLISVLPLYHAYPFMVTCLIPLLEGACVCYTQSLIPHELFATMRDNKVTLFVGVPQLFSLIERSVSEKLNKYGRLTASWIRASLEFWGSLSRLSGRRMINPFVRDFHRMLGGQLRAFVSGGAKLEPQTAAGLQRLGFQVLEGYGLTETSPIVTINDNRRDKFHTVGRPIPGVEVRILAPDENGTGEVAVRGKNIMKGYDRAPELTAQALKDGWFLTGDLGSLDKDGYLQLDGRKNEIIVLPSGKKVNPEEVEACYLKSPYIKEIAVFYPKKGPEAGHLSAVIVPDEDRLRREKHVDINFKIRWELDCPVKLAPYQRIKGFVLTSQPMPRTRLGKLVRYKVESIYESLISRHGEKKTQEAVSPFESMALKYISRILKKDVRIDDHLELDLGLDSLGRIELLSSLQDLINAGIDDTLAYEMFQARTIRELLAKAQKALPEDAFSGLLKREDSVFWSEVLKQEPSEATKKKLKLRFNGLEKGLSFLVLLGLRAFLVLFFACRARGKNNIPAKGPFIIAPNHVSYLDAFYLLRALPFRLVLETYFAGFGAIFRHPLIAWSMRFFRLVPIDVDLDLAETLKTCRYLLTQGKVLVYFAEGQRSGDGQLKEFRKGLGILVRESGSGVLPVYLKGAFKAWPRSRKFPLPAKVTVEIGKFLTFEKLTGGRKDEDYSAIAQVVRGRIESLANEGKP
ncbi:MAG: AMP-binding protein [Candidatus Omnitrophota bacterium]